MTSEPDVDERHRLLLQQMRLECIAVDNTGIMTPFPCGNPDTPSRVMVSMLGERVLLFRRHDLPEALLAALAEVDPAAVLEDEIVVTSILAREEPCRGIWRNRASVVPAGSDAMRFPDVERLPTDDIGATAFGIVIDGEVAAACSSVREDDRSAEAWVFTDERYRRRGFGSQVVAAWASDLRRRGKTPFYSYLVENTASHALANSLGLMPFAESMGFD